MNPSDRQAKLVLLGTGTPNPDPGRSGPAAAVVFGDSGYLIDAGPGVVRQAAAAFEKGMHAIRADRLSRCFITHLHSDHTLGLPDLILSPWVLERDQPLELWGPTGLRAMVDHLLDAYTADIRERLIGLEPVNETGHRVAVHEIEAGRIYEDENICVDAFAVNHGSWPAFGYRFRTANRAIVISGDTAPFPGWEEAYADCEILVHEVQSEVGLAQRSPAWQAYHRAVHTGTTKLAEVASAVRPKRLVLTHQLFHGVSEQDLLAEIREIYDGEVVSGHDLDVF